MLAHAFDAWSCERVALRCDAANGRSARAIERLGARPEGVLRGHRRRHDGTVADTAYFSVLRTEWPEVRRGLLARVGRPG
jgi:RimJ/RimL family protein N-acetyltransferase